MSVTPTHLVVLRNCVKSLQTRYSELDLAITSQTRRDRPNTQVIEQLQAEFRVVQYRLRVAYRNYRWAQQQSSCVDNNLDATA